VECLTSEALAKSLDRHMWNTRRESPTARGSRQQFESGGRDTRAEFRERERPRRDEQRTEFRERSRSPERGDRSPRRASPERYSLLPLHDSNLGPGRALTSAGPSNLRRSPPRYRRTAPPPPPPPRRPNAGNVPRMSASQGQNPFAVASRPKAAAVDPRHLTVNLGKSRALPELLSLHQRHGDHFNGFHIAAFWSKFKALAHGELGGLRDRLAPVCEQTVRMLPELDARQLANVAHAFAKAGLIGAGPWESVWAALPEAALRSLGDGNPQDFSNTAWAFATAGHVAPELFNAISAEALRRRLGGFNAQDLSNTAWAFATAGHESSELFHAISAEAVRRGLGGFNPQHLSNTAWAFAVSNPLRADELFGTALFTTQCANVEKSFSCTARLQLHQWSLWREERGALWPPLNESLRQACHDAFITPGETTSQLQSNVVREIRSHGVQVKEEHRCETSGYSIDALVTLKDGKRVAVEVDGPSHFVGRSQQPTGATLLKHRQLRYFGWRLESVPYWEWVETWSCTGCRQAGPFSTNTHT